MKTVRTFHQLITLLKKDSSQSLNIHIADCSGLYSQLNQFHVNVAKIRFDLWDVSKVEDMSYMFVGCNPFDFERNWK